MEAAQELEGAVEEEPVVAEIRRASMWRRW